MAIDYDSIAQGALDAISEAGLFVTLHKPAGGEPAPWVPGQTPPSATDDYEGTGAVFGYKQDQIDGTTILQGDQRLLLAPQIEAEPQSGDTVTVGAKTYAVIAVEIVAPAGVPVLYKLQIRGV